MAAIDRKRAELKRKVNSLAEEFAHWREVSEAGKLLEKHNSQIRRITLQLEGAQKILLDQIGAAGADLMGKSYDLEQEILELHRIWGFFRDKFALRQLDWFKSFLAAADELAWHCYRPACEAAIEAKNIRAEAVKEPPLTFFTGSNTPFAMSRNASYRSEIPRESGLGIQAFGELLKELPVSVIGVPWFQLAHLPDAVVIGHETGHNVEDDLGLTDALKQRLTGCLQAAQAPDRRQEAWLSWYGEIFADIYGTLATGPAYAGAQADFLAASAEDIATENPEARDGWGEYPTTYLRMLIVFETLSQLQYGEEAQRRLDEWKTRYPAHALAAFEPDVPVVVEAFLQGKFFGDKALRNVLVFTKQQYENAVADAGNVLGGYDPDGTQVRSLLATARIAFEKDPDKFLDNKLQQRILEKISRTIKTGTRSGMREKKGEKDTLDRLDYEKGASLLNRIAALNRPGV